jgi:hypothetical protein
MPATSLEERMTALEAEIDQIKKRLEAVSPQAAAPWWRRIVGIYKDDQEFEEAMRLGRDYRESQRPKDAVSGD